MAFASGCNRVLFMAQNVGLSASGSVSLLLTHNLGETPEVRYVLSTVTASPVFIAVVTRNGSQVGIVGLGAGTNPNVADVVCDRWYTPSQ